MAIPHLFAELKRRNVYKVAIAYAVVGWLLIQVATQVFPFFDIPNWIVRLVVLLILLGFPISLVIAWAFELTPDGIRRTETVGDVPAARGKHTWIYVVVIAAALSAGLFFVGRLTAPKTSSALATPEKSIAVLPFENLSRDPDNAYFTDGIQDEILARLGKVADLKVISRTSTQRFKSAPGDLRQIAQQLDVAHVLEGSVQKSGDKVRVNVQLIRAADDSHLWAEIYDRRLTDVFAVESEIAQKITTTLQATLTGSEQRAIAVRPTDDTEAHQLYLKGRFFWNKRTAADLQKAADYFQQAIDKDPQYALAYVGLADSYMLFSAFSVGDSKGAFELAKKAALRAIELDDSLGEAHTSLAQLLATYEFNFPASIKEFERAIALNPNYATAHHWFGNSVLSMTGQFERSIAEGKRAVELDPLSLIINADLAQDYGAARRWDEALTQFRKTLEMDPRFYYARSGLGVGLQFMGDLPGALAEYKQAVALDDDPNLIALVAQAQAYLGHPEEARRLLQQLEETARTRYVSKYSLAIVHIALGEDELAIDNLEAAYRERNGPDVAFIKIDPLVDPLRGNPRFERLVEKIFGPNEAVPKANSSPL